ncbi:MAG: MFS transporter [Intrasporangium sp.]|uniref:MFS transporter n=1 Tax=Intrasporangium sp. TaxID=1925024 RepID=UPI002649FE2B|nr:MFS transporter [Intrasporangium sp.]MDN5796356.1 MFS transporter [Intrasporangium sp.]
MDLRPYRHVLRVPDLRRILVLGFLIRVPMWAGEVLLTLHVVAHLDRSYSQAGLLTAAATVALAISGPWRGRLLDRIGLRRTVAPSLVVQAVCWSIAPWVDYAPLLALAALAGLFAVPTFSILRQVILRSVPQAQRRTALSLDSVTAELSFMVGPAVGVWLATAWHTGWALLACQMAAVLVGLVLWAYNPPLREGPGDRAAVQTGQPAGGVPIAPAPDSPQPVVLRPARRAFRGFITAPVAAVYVAAMAATIVLTGTDVGVVAALRDFGRTGSIGWVLTLWGLGSFVGGLLYGAWERSISVYWLLAALAVVTMPLAAATSVPSFAVLITVSGLLCAPTITATVEHLSRVVPERFRGEMMGWHGSAMTAGAAFGAPVAGVAIDRGGWQWGFLVVSTVGLGVAGLGMLMSRRTPAVPDADSEQVRPAAILEF